MGTTEFQQAATSKSAKLSLQDLGVLRRASEPT